MVIYNIKNPPSIKRGGGGNRIRSVVKTAILPFSYFFPDLTVYYLAKLFCSLDDYIDKYKTLSHSLLMIRS